MARKNTSILLTTRSGGCIPAIVLAQIAEQSRKKEQPVLPRIVTAVLVTVILTCLYGLLAYVPALIPGVLVAKLIAGPMFPTKWFALLPVAITGCAHAVLTVSVLSFGDKKIGLFLKFGRE